jgi:hypothetical protein
MTVIGVLACDQCGRFIARRDGEVFVVATRAIEQTAGRGDLAARTGIITAIPIAAVSWSEGRGARGSRVIGRSER